jgi:type VI secretion system secreted protein VgrG
MPQESISQQDRLFRLQTPLGPDKLVLRKFSGTEGMSEQFRFTLDMVSEDWNIKLEDVLQKKFTVSIRQSDGATERFFDGYVSRFWQPPSPGRLATYHAEIVPWLWFLNLSHGCHIYQDKTVRQVIKEVFEKFGYQQDRDFKFLLRGKHLPWEYCSQYRETAFDFVSRLMEIEGMYYYFQHGDGRHVMIITDSKTTHVPCPYQSTFRFDKVTGLGYFHEDDTIPSWKPEKQMRPSRYAHRDFNFLTPHADLSGQADSSEEDQEDENPKDQIYDYPGEYEFKKDAEDWARLRIEEQEMDHSFTEGSGCCRAMIPGYKFTLTDHDRKDQNKTWLITRISHEGTNGTFMAGSDGEAAKYESKFRCISADDQYRTGRKTKKSQMLGMQTAFVMGPKGEEVHTDPYGRVKVKFHWDRSKKQDDTCSCWLRVMQPWTGVNYGHIWLPRVGQEVVVDFLEGDPDRPLVVGCVYNKDSMPPYKLPDNKTVSGFKTRSTKGGTTDNFNEIYLEDKKDSELFRMQAEKDMQIIVKHDQSISVQHDQQINVGHDQTELVQNDQHITVQGERRDSVGKNRSTTIGSDDQLKAGGNILIDAAGNIHLRAGGSIILEAAGGIKFLGEGISFINVNALGVQIQGPQVLLNCGLPFPEGALLASALAPNLPGALGSLGNLGGALGSAGIGSALASALQGAGLNPSALASALGGGNLGDLGPVLQGAGLDPSALASALGGNPGNLGSILQGAGIDPSALTSALTGGNLGSIGSVLQGAGIDTSALASALTGGNLGDVGLLLQNAGINPSTLASALTGGNLSGVMQNLGSGLNPEESLQAIGGSLTSQVSQTVSSLSSSLTGAGAASLSPSAGGGSMDAVVSQALQNFGFDPSVVQAMGIDPSQMLAALQGGGGQETLQPIGGDAPAQPDAIPETGSSADDENQP